MSTRVLIFVLVFLIVSTAFLVLGMVMEPGTVSEAVRVGMIVTLLVVLGGLRLLVGRWAKKDSEEL